MSSSFTLVLPWPPPSPSSSLVRLLQKPLAFSPHPSLPRFSSLAPSLHFVDTIRSIPRSETSESLGQSEKNFRFECIEDFNDTLVSLLAANEPDFALKLFDDLPAFGLRPDSSTYSLIIRCYCKKNDPFESRRVLDLMVKDRYRPNAMTLTTLINSFCRRGRTQKAFEVFNFMVEIGCKPKVQTYNCLLKGLCFVGKVEEANLMLGKMKENREANPDIYSYTAVMDGFCKVGRSDEALELLDEAIKKGLNPSVVTYNSLFNGYSREGTPKKGIRLLKQMQERGCQPDYITYSSLLHGLLKWGKIKDAFRVHKEMVVLGFKVDERMMNTLLRALCRRSWAEEEPKLNDVYEVFDRMRSWGYEIYPNTRYLVIHTLCVGKETGRALVELNEMVNSGHFPRMVTVNRIIRGLCEEGRVEDALSVLILMCETSRIPSKISYNYLIDEFNRRGSMMGACTVYGAALKLGITPHKMPGNALMHC